ncbi:MAG: hypothetical protein OXK17_08105, partial [Thaumarchaeota archaeon]|nr:hypothetical protein [Nitrososphaerota archaeon]
PRDCKVRLDSANQVNTYLHRIAGGYSGKDHRMPVCCGVMRSRMQECDKILPSSLKKYGASLRVLYLLK